MNLKNSKFFKRIQMLRRISKEKLRKERESKRIEDHLKNAFCENSGTSMANEMVVGKVEKQPNPVKKCSSKIHIDKEKIKTKLKLEHEKCITHQQSSSERISNQSSERILNRAEEKCNGLIHLNNTCYKVKCFAGTKQVKKGASEESLPSVKTTRGSICVSNSRYNIISKIAKTLGYKVVNENNLWNIMWTDSTPGVEIYKSMKRFQQINHFPGMMEICRKDLLSRNLNRMLKLYPKDYRIFPKTWVFPADYGEALNYANHQYKKKMFIIKPDAGAQGRGIWLTNDLKHISPTERMICQTYICKPLLIDDYKFDLRVYTLITSIDPLRVFVYNEGLARLATNKYVEPSVNNCNNLFMHLTNYSVNKRNSQYELCDDDDCGSKRNFDAINNWMRHRDYDVKEFWDKIDDIIIKTILSSWPILKHSYNACFPSHDKIQACFEILGFDILVDAKLRPYILEVNHSPSFHTNELVDRQVKKPLIRDTLTLIGAVLVDKRQIMREDRKRIKRRLLNMKSGNVSRRCNDSNSSPPNSGKSQSNTSIESPISPIAQQIAWEESHLGGYRRIMPPQDPIKLSYYCKFYSHQNQASIFSKTACSKKREEVAKKLRQDLEEKRQKQMEMFKHKGTAIKFEERQRRRAGISRQLVEKQRQHLLRCQAQWSPGFISASEERVHETYMHMRSEILKELKVTEMIYTFLYNSGNLTKTDIAKFPHLYSSLEKGIQT